jgi:parallel beta-helix repeat protein
MNSTGKQVKILGMVAMMLFITLLVCPGFATVYIPNNPDAGTWDPDGRVYTLTTDVDEPIVILENDLTLDGNGHTVTGSESGFGIYVGYDYVVLTRLNVTGFAIGIGLADSAYATVINNTTFDNTTKGIEVGNGSTYCVVCMNTILGNPTGMYFGNYSRWNSIYNNSFINNNTQVTGGFTNDNTYYEAFPTGGNYWDDWDAQYDDGDDDGFLDEPRTYLPGSIDGDQLPLANLYLIKFFDDGVATNGIRARGKTPEVRLAQFRNILEDVQEDIMLGDYASACVDLDDALGACDGEKKDLIIGPDVETLYYMMVDLKVALGC